MQKPAGRSASEERVSLHMGSYSAGPGTTRDFSAFPFFRPSSPSSFVHSRAQPPTTTAVPFSLSAPSPVPPSESLRWLLRGLGSLTQCTCPIRLASHASFPFSLVEWDSSPTPTQRSQPFYLCPLDPELRCRSWRPHATMMKRTHPHATSDTGGLDRQPENHTHHPLFYSKQRNHAPTHTRLKWTDMIGFLCSGTHSF